MTKAVLAGVMLIALLAFEASTAAALPQVLPLPDRSITGGAGETIMETVSGKRLVCPEATLEAIEENGDGKGSFHIDLKGCYTKIAGIKFKCTGLGDESGVVLVSGSWYAVDSPSKEPLLLFELGATHFECSGGFALDRLTGNVLCRIEEPTAMRVTHELACEQEKGKAGQTKYLNDEGAEVSAELKSSENEKTEEGAALSATGAHVTYPEAVEFDA